MRRSVLVHFEKCIDDEHARLTELRERAFILTGIASQSEQESHALSHRQIVEATLIPTSSNSLQNSVTSPLSAIWECAARTSMPSSSAVPPTGAGHEPSLLRSLLMQCGQISVMDHTKCGIWICRFYQQVKLARATRHVFLARTGSPAHADCERSSRRRCQEQPFHSLAS